MGRLLPYERMLPPSFVACSASACYRIHPFPRPKIRSYDEADEQATDGHAHAARDDLFERKVWQLHPAR